MSMVFRCLTLKVIGCITSKSKGATKSLSDVTSTRRVVKNNKTSQVDGFINSLITIKLLIMVWVSHWYYSRVPTRRTFPSRRFCGCGLERGSAQDPPLGLKKSWWVRGLCVFLLATVVYTKNVPHPAPDVVMATSGVSRLPHHSFLSQEPRSNRLRGC